MRNMKKSTAGVVIGVTVLLSACAGKNELPAVSEKNISDSSTSVGASDKDPSEKIFEGMLSDPVACQQKNTYDVLNVATYITRIDGMYFIADCYHDQIIYHDNIVDPLNQWNVLTNEVHYAHTIASDGTLFVVDDTENNRLMVFQKMAEGYVHTQTLENIGMRPHYVQYDAKNHVFMAIGIQSFEKVIENNYM